MKGGNDMDELNNAPAPGGQENAKPKAKRRNLLIAGAAGLVLIAGLATGAVYLTGSHGAPDAGDAPTATEQKADDGGQESSGKEEEPVCDHDWTMTYKTVRHDAVTHTETVAPVYASKTSYHTVCNDCEQTIDGIADQHIKETGHSGYSTNVPITGEVLVSEGYSHEVTDTPAYDETVPDKVVCTICGESKPVTDDSAAA